MYKYISMEVKINIEGSQYPVLETFGLSDLRRAYGDNCSGLEYKDTGHNVPTNIALNEKGNFIVPFDGWTKAERKYFILKDSSTTKAEQVKSLVEQIQQKYHRKWKRPVRDVEPDNNTRNKNDMKHTRKDITIHLSWCHWDIKKKAYIQVYLKDGGGLREVQFKADEATYRVLLEKATDLYFPHGVSSKGSKTAMEICSLGDFQRNVIPDFVVDGEQCTYAVYLRKMGLVPSKCRLHLLTKDSTQIDFNKEDSANALSKSTRKRVICDKNDDLISAYMIKGTVSKSMQVKYCKEDVSSFSEVITTINASSLNDCTHIASLGDSFITEEEYHPLTDFHVCQIVVGSEVFLEYDIVDNPDEDVITKIYSFPQATSDAELILHWPDEINGYELDVLIVGIVSSQHGNIDTYTWYCDGAAILSGANMCIMQPKQEGKYHCVVEKSGNTAISKSVMVIKSPGIITKKASIETNASNKTATRTSAGGIDTTMERASLNPHTFGNVPAIDFDDIEVTFDEKNKLGEGAVGKVYKGLWLGTDVAIKSLKLGRRNHLSDVMENEIKVLGKIRHPNIIQIMATSRSAQNIHILCEYIDGFNLEEIIFEGKKEEIGLSTHKKNLIAIQAAKGLAYLHGMNPPIIHHYLVEKYTLVTKLCDLGVSRMKPLNATRTININVGAGTPCYMAPEILLESCKSTSHSDMWSYGICLLELLTENDSWNMDESTEDIIEFLKENMTKKKFSDAIEHIAEVCSSDTQDIIRNLLTYVPSQRIPAIEVVHHFQKLI